MPQIDGSSFTCTCREGFTGDTCEGNACAVNPCLNGGTCTPQTDGSSFTCACPNGFTGATCESNACAPNPCQNGDTCEDEIN